MIDHYGNKVRVKLNKDYGHKVNVYIVYELGASSSNDSDPTLKKCLFGAVTFTKKRRY